MKRIFKTELMDDPQRGPDEIRDDLVALDRINWLLQSFRLIVKQIRELLQIVKPPLIVADVGAGSGYLGNHLANLFGLDVRYLRIEPSESILAAMPPDSNQQSLQAMSPTLPLAKNSVDLCVSSLVLHHLSDEIKIPFLYDTLRVARHRIIHHDLLRNRLAYWGAILLTKIVTNSSIAQHDGPVSVRRSLTLHEWKQLLPEELKQNITFKRSWPWRINLIGRAENVIKKNN